MEKRIFVRIPPEMGSRVIDLAIQANAALTRAMKLPPGDRTEAIRFESLHSVLDQIAVAAMANGEPYEMTSRLEAKEAQGSSVYGPGLSGGQTVEGAASQWIAEGGVVIELRLPHFPGITKRGGVPGVGPPKPSERWTSTEGRPKDAIRERFEYLIEKALQTSDDTVAVRPSGVSNRVLTEGLRAYSQRKDGQGRVDAPVIYRDGSAGRPFPFRALSLTTDIPENWKTLRFALMSIRHVEMDTIVDGAWLRNVHISRSRPAGYTDDIVFETSLRQLRRLAADEPTLIFMYQTGLETAIVGFYRALIHHLLDQPRSVCVVPCYYHMKGTFSDGTAWATL